MDMDMYLLIMVSLIVITIILIVGILFFIQNRKNKRIKKQLEKLEVEKNRLDTSPVIPELSKIETINKTEKLESMYNNWKDRLNSIRSNQIPKINDMLLEADFSLQKQDYKSTLYKIARLEMEIYKVRTNSEFLLKEIKEITSSEERNRALITALKAKYRDLYQKYTKEKNEFGDIASVIELQFESIAKRFETFEEVMERNEYTEVAAIIKSIDEMLKHMNLVIEEMPHIYLLATSILPKKIEQVTDEYKKMTNKGFPLDYLNVEPNIEEATLKIKEILDRAKILNIEASLVELKALNDYFENLFVDFEKEKVNRHNYEETSKVFQKKLKKINKLVQDIFGQLDTLKKEFHLSNIELEELEKIYNGLEQINSDYKVFKGYTGNNAFAYSKLIREIEGLTVKLGDIEERLDNVLNSIGNMKEDEVRAKQQLEEIKLILKKSKNKIREYELPIIPNNYYVELNDAQQAIREIIKELEKHPITIEVLNTRVDTARDLVLKLYGTTKEMIKTAMFAEMAIVYGNRYRSEESDLNKHLNFAERLFFKGDYQKSLELSINSLNKVEPGIYDKLLALYANK